MGTGFITNRNFFRHGQDPQDLALIFLGFISWGRTAMTEALETDTGAVMRGVCLPVELYRDIFCHVTSKEDLRSLSVVCRKLQSEAEFFIYHTITTSHRGRTEYLCDLITSSPHRHMLVRSLSISNDDNEMHVSPARDRDYWERVARLLHDLPCLEILKLQDNMSSPHGNHNSWVLSRCTFQLRHFDSDFVFDTALLTFLRSQRSLRNLYWTEAFSDDNSAKALGEMDVGCTAEVRLAPSLSLLNTNSARFALKCMPAATLSHVWIIGPCAYEYDGWERYIQEFVHGGGAKSLRSLRMNLPYGKRSLISVLESLAKGAPGLRSLGFIPFFNASDTALIAALSEFKHLQSLITWNVIGRDTSHAVAQACPSLRLVACLHYSYSHEYVLLPVNPLGTPRPHHDPEYALWRNV